MSNDKSKEDIDSTSCKTTEIDHYNIIEVTGWSTAEIYASLKLSQALKEDTGWKQLWQSLGKLPDWLDEFVLKQETKDHKLLKYVKETAINNNHPLKYLDQPEFKEKDDLLLSTIQDIVEECNLSDIIIEEGFNTIKNVWQFRKVPTGNEKPDTPTGTSMGSDDTSSSFSSSQSSNGLPQTNGSKANRRMPPAHMDPVSDDLRCQQMISDSYPPKFAIVTTDKEGSMDFLSHSDLPADMMEAQCHQYMQDEYLRGIVTCPNLALEYPVIEVNGVHGVLVECCSGCRTNGGSLEAVSQLLKTAGERNWPLRTIFVIGSCKVNQVPGQHNIPLGTLVLGVQCIEYTIGSLYEDHVKFEGRRHVVSENPEFWEDKLQQLRNTGNLQHHREVVNKHVMSDNLIVAHSAAACAIAQGLGLSDHSLFYENEGTGVVTAVRNSAGLKPDVVLLKGVSGVVGEDSSVGMDMEYFSEPRRGVNEPMRQRMCNDMSLSAVLKMISLGRENYT